MAAGHLHNHSGEAPFTRIALALYDQCVLGLTCHLVWRCPTSRILSWYGEHLTANHLEVGVGTGLFPDRAEFPQPNPRLALLDLNANCLERTSHRLGRYVPQTHLANILEPLRIDVAPFDSIALNYVLHCVPGSFPGKGIVFSNLKALLRPRGILFGATVLSKGVDNTPLANRFIRACNSRGVFSNAQDTLAGLRCALEQQFDEVRIETRGSVALFSGRMPD